MRTFFDKGGVFRLGALPMAHFINGHGYFVGSSHVKLDVRRDHPWPHPTSTPPHLNPTYSTPPAYVPNELPAHSL